MKAKYLFTAILLLGINILVNAQIIECGTIAPANYSLLTEFHQKRGSLMNNDVTFIPIKAHIIRTSAGTGGLTITQLTEAIAVMNNYYRSSDIQFYICDSVNFINNSLYYDFDSNDEDNMASSYDVPNLINIYFANTVASNGTAVCGYAYYPGGNDHILMSNSCATNGSTLTHEMGHFFNLPHTHGESFGITDELVNGSNCATAGDYICDTPADPTLSNTNVSSSCQYTGNETDNNGDFFVPDPTNIMSYSLKPCRTNLSQEQFEVVSYTAHDVRNYFICNSGGTLNTIVAPNILCKGQTVDVEVLTNLSFNPANVFTAELSSSTGSFANPVAIGTLSSTTSGIIQAILPPTAQGNYYKIRVVSSDPVLTGNTAGKVFKIQGTPTANLNLNKEPCSGDPAFTLIGGTPPGGSYSGDGVTGNYFNPQIAGTGTHLISYSVANACTTVSAIDTIIVEQCTGIAKNDFLNELQLIPNPAKNNVNILLKSTKHERLAIEILNITGKQFYYGFIDFQNNGSKEIDLTNYPNGIYLIKFYAETGSFVRKLVVNH